MQNKILFAILSSAFFTFSGFAQLSPPGLGKTNTGFWSAVGVKQQLDSTNVLMAYAGLGTISGLQSSNFFKLPSIKVINAEVYHTIKPGFKYSYALSYRRQNHYDYTLADDKGHPLVTQEFRAYGRLSYALKSARAKYSFTLRQEVREFFDKGFTTAGNELQLRTRFKAGVAIPLNGRGNSLTGTAEALFSITNNNGWDTFGYKESRFCLYYTYAPAATPIVFDVGYMNNLIGHGHDLTDAGYLAVDVVLVDVF